MSGVAVLLKKKNSTAGPTFTAMVTEIAPDVALTCATLWEAPVSRPPAVTFATDVFEDDHVFFFQAEAGIRALYVTGVQTCALPISARQIFLHQGKPEALGDAAMDLALD